MFKYLCPVGKPNQYLNAMDYTEDPIVPEGFELVEGIPPEDAVPYIELTLAQKLDALFLAQSDEIKAQFGTIRSAIKNYLELSPPEIGAVRLMIQTVSVPPELEAAKTELLALLPGDA